MNFSAVGSAEGAAAAAELLGNLVADQNGTHGWNMVVAPRLARDGSLRRLSAARLVVTIPAAPSFELSAPETLRLVVPAAAVLSRAAPRMALDALILRPAQGSATLAAPGLATEVVVRAGGVVVDDGYGGEFVDTPPALNVTLENDAWADSLLTYVDQRYKVCPEVIIPNVTAQPNRSNVTFCWGDGNASNATNGTCAFVGNGTNASVYETWAWGWPYRANVPVDGGGTPLVQYASPTHLAIGGAGWVEAEAAARGELFLTGEPNLPVDGAHHQLHHSVAGRRLGEGGGDASNASNASAPATASSRCSTRRARRSTGSARRAASCPPSAAVPARATRRTTRTRRASTTRAT